MNATYTYFCVCGVPRCAYELAPKHSTERGSRCDGPANLNDAALVGDKHCLHRRPCDNEPGSPPARTALSEVK